MRRALVLSNENARHPFRASLPAHVFDALPEADASFEDGDAERRDLIQPQLEPEVVAANTAASGELSWWQLTRTDVRGFVSTYLATLLAALVFIM